MFGRSDGETQPIRLGPPHPFAEGLPQPGHISLSRDGQLLIVSHFTGAERIWKATLIKKDSPAGESLELSRLHLDYVALSPDGRWAATGNKWGQDVDIWDASTGEHVCELTSYGSATVPPATTDVANTAAWRIADLSFAIAFSPHGLRLPVLKGSATAGI